MRYVVALLLQVWLATVQVELMVALRLLVLLATAVKVPRLLVV